MNDEEYYSEQFRAVAGKMAALFIGFIACAVITWILSINGCSEGRVVVERDTIRDTIRIEKPVPMYDTIIRYVKKSPILIHDTVNVLKKDSNIYITPDTQVVIPISQKVYEDSLYKAWVSGYMPALDSIHVYRTTININTKEYIDRRFYWGLQGGAGIDVLSGKPTIYIGLGGGIHF